MQIRTYKNYLLQKFCETEKAIKLADFLNVVSLSK